jgi:GAG-pre-integrase domain
MGMAEKAFGVREIPVCEFCKRRGHMIEKCWTKYSEMRPPRSSRYPKAEEKTSFLATNNENEENTYALLTVNDSKATLDESVFYVDSGWSHHMCLSVHELKQVSPYNGYVTLADGNSIRVTQKGRFDGYVRDAERINMFVMEKVYVVSELACALLSVKQLNTKGIEVIFANRGAALASEGKFLARGAMRHGLYVLEFVRSFCSITRVKSSIYDWHCWFGHISGRKLCKLSKLYNEMPQQIPDKVECVECSFAKLCKRLFPQTANIYTPLKLLASDMCGLIFPRSLVRLFSCTT